jgi:hypothetical protein
LTGGSLDATAPQGRRNMTTAHVDRTRLVKTMIEAREIHCPVCGSGEWDVATRDSIHLPFGRQASDAVMAVCCDCSYVALFCSAYLDHVKEDLDSQAGGD